MRVPLILPLVLSLAACGTPQEQCVNRASRDLRILDRLIAGLQVDVDRGFRMQQVTVTQTRWVFCGGWDDGWGGDWGERGRGGHHHGGSHDKDHDGGTHEGGAHEGGSHHHGRHHHRGHRASGRMCLADVDRTYERPVAIDVAAETKRLAGLRAKRATLNRSTARQIAACKAQFPEP